MKKSCIPAPDGYQYGVRYADGSVAHGWNGRTQLDRAQEHIFYLRKVFGGNEYSLVRREIVVKNPLRGQRPAGYGPAPWEHVDIDPWRKPLTNAMRTPKHSFVGARWIWRGLTLARVLTAQAEATRRRLHVSGRQQ